MSDPSARLTLSVLQGRQASQILVDPLPRRPFRSAGLPKVCYPARPSSSGLELPGHQLATLDHSVERGSALPELSRRQDGNARGRASRLRAVKGEPATDHRFNASQWFCSSRNQSAADSPQRKEIPLYSEIKTVAAQQLKLVSLTTIRT